jgi:hypothetical protein
MNKEEEVVVQLCSQGLKQMDACEREQAQNLIKIR